MRCRADEDSERLLEELEDDPEDEAPLSLLRDEPERFEEELLSLLRELDAPERLDELPVFDELPEVELPEDDPRLEDELPEEDPRLEEDEDELPLRGVDWLLAEDD